jgi:pantoate ligase / CMP/dCMP kinase
LRERGQGEVDLAELEKSISERDLIDSTREISPLKQADDAVEIISDDLTIDEVVDLIVDMYQLSIK